MAAAYMAGFYALGDFKTFLCVGFNVAIEAVAIELALEALRLFFLLFQRQMVVLHRLLLV